MDVGRLPDIRTLGAPVRPLDVADLDRTAAERFGPLTRRQCPVHGMSDDAAPSAAGRPGGDTSGS